MSDFIKIDFSEFEKYNKKLLDNLKGKARDEFFEKNLKIIATITLTNVILLTPVISGQLRKGWTGGQKIPAYIYVSGQKARKVVRSYKFDIVNNVSYAEYVEHGHRFKKNKGFVEGRHMLKKSLDLMNEKKDYILKQNAEKFLGDAFSNGNI